MFLQTVLKIKKLWQRQNLRSNCYTETLNKSVVTHLRPWRVALLRGNHLPHKLKRVRWHHKAGVSCTNFCSGEWFPLGDRCRVWPLLCFHPVTVLYNNRPTIISLSFFNSVTVITLKLPLFGQEEFTNSKIYQKEFIIAKIYFQHKIVGSHRVLPNNISKYNYV